MIKADGNPIGLVDRPIAAVLAIITVGMIVWTLLAAFRQKPDVAATTPQN
jgi:TctA family transporter